MFKRSSDEQGDWIEKREEHYCKLFGPMSEDVMHSSDVKDVHVDIYQFPPNDERPHWTLITGGMSDLRQSIPRDAEGLAPRAEILMYAGEPSNWMFNVLKGLAEMPFEDDTFLHWYHTVPNGKPMTAEPSNLTSFFFLPPYFEEPQFADLKIEGDAVDFLWMIPITESERQYAMDKGSQALEEVFEKAGLDIVVDETRESLV
ncbi:MAG: suppressor of fused domain protein [Pirellulales bacterium]|nr:suppressor of fused domain protein [Pirellulales bacterium]